MEIPVLLTTSQSAVNEAICTIDNPMGYKKNVYGGYIKETSLNNYNKIKPLIEADAGFGDDVRMPSIENHTGGTMALVAIELIRSQLEFSAQIMKSVEINKARIWLNNVMPLDRGQNEPSNYDNKSEIFIDVYKDEAGNYSIGGLGSDKNYTSTLSVNRSVFTGRFDGNFSEKKVQEIGDKIKKGYGSGAGFPQGVPVVRGGGINSGGNSGGGYGSGEGSGGYGGGGDDEDPDGMTIRIVPVGGGGGGGKKDNKPKHQQ